MESKKEKWFDYPITKPIKNPRVRARMQAEVMVLSGVFAALLIVPATAALFGDLKVLYTAGIPLSFATLGLVARD